MSVAFWHLNNAELNILYIWLNGTYFGGTQTYKHNIWDSMIWQRQKVNLQIQNRWISIYRTTIRTYIGIVNILISTKISIHVFLQCTHREMGSQLSVIEIMAEYVRYVI